MPIADRRQSLRRFAFDTWTRHIENPVRRERLEYTSRARASTFDSAEGISIEGGDKRLVAKDRSWPIRKIVAGYERPAEWPKRSPASAGEPGSARIRSVARRISLFTILASEGRKDRISARRRNPGRAFHGRPPPLLDARRSAPAPADFAPRHEGPRARPVDLRPSP